MSQIICQDIYKKYDTVEVLKGVSLSIEKGEIVAIVGPSGAGKSTLLHILGTLDEADKGSLNIEGQELGKLKTNQLAKFRNERLGFVFQFHHLLPEFTAIENVTIPALIAKKDEKQVKEKAKELLNYLGLSHRFTHKPSEMSGGEQQRVAVARALINDPSIIFADEPTGNLDSKNSSEMHELILELREKYQQTFVIVTHNKGLSELADRTFEMRDGKIWNP